MLVVSNTSPLCNLAIIGRLHPFNRTLAELVIQHFSLGGEIEITRWVATGEAGYTETRGARSRHLFGVEGLLYSDMPHSDGSLFDGTVALTLEIETGGVRKKIDTVVLGRPKVIDPDVPANASTRVPAWPDDGGIVKAEGFGKWSLGGRFGAVLVVDNANDYTSAQIPLAGCLRWAVTQNVPRTVLFRFAQGTDATIPLKEMLPTEFSRLTIAGQSALGMGVCGTGDFR